MADEWTVGEQAKNLGRALGVSSGDAAKDIKTLYKAIYLKNREPELVYQQFAQKQTDTDIPLNKGDNIEYTRYAPLVDAPLHDSEARDYALLTEGSTPDPEQYYAQTVTAVLDEYGNWLNPSSRLWLTAFDPKLGGLSRLLGVQSGKTLDLKIQNVVAQGFMGMRGDSDTTHQGKVVIALTGSTAAVPKFDSLPSGIESGSTGVIVFTSGKNQGTTRTFPWASSETLTMQKYGVACSLPQIPQDNDTAWVCSTEGLIAGAKITPALIKKAVALLETQETPMFPDGFYHAVIPAGAMKYDFMNDTEYINLKHYAAPKDLYRNLVGEFHNVRFHKDTHPYRHTAGVLGTYVADADPQMISIFGTDAFGNVKLKGVNQQFYVNPPESTTTNPLKMFGSIGWKNMYAPLVLNGSW
ncbi:hypothetical protein ES708_07288 [subsurface metagenome]